MSVYLVGTKNFWIILMIVFLRYAVLALVPFLIFYGIKKHAWRFKKIQWKYPNVSDYTREIIYSAITSVIFAVVGYIVFLTPVSGYTQAYFDMNQYGWGYLAFSVVVTILIHDTYFYWMHRAIHHKSLYRVVHRVHHLSINPSPWAAFAFHPLEAIAESGIIILVAFIYPIHPLAIGIFLLFMMAYNVYGHLGYELYPKGFAASSIGKWINTSVNHNMHHQQFTGNYGLYFLFWDRWMGTLQRDYEEQFEALKARKKVV